MSASEGGQPSNAPLVIRVVGLPGSLRASSTTRMAIRCALLGAEEDGARTHLLDLAAYDLPFLGREHEPPSRKALERFLADIRAADGMIWGSPEIHGSFSGVLKNALDLTSVGDFEGKMVGLIGVAGGEMGAGETLSHLRAIGRALHAWVVPIQVSIADSKQAFDSRGEPLDERVAHRLNAVGRQVAHFARLHKCENHLQFVKEWQGAANHEGTNAVR